jgi:hypothetical protein
MSGILGALIGSRVLDWLRIPEGSSSFLTISERWGKLKNVHLHLRHDILLRFHKFNSLRLFR